MLNTQEVYEWKCLARESDNALQFLSLFAHVNGADQCPTSTDVPPRLDLEKNVHPIIDVLTQQGLTFDAAEAISALYVSQLQEAAGNFQLKFSAAFLLLRQQDGSSLREECQSTLQNIYSQSFEAEAHRIRENLIEVVRLLRRETQIYTLPGETKGLGPQARMLLEEAWQRNHKLNAAEKRKLAEGCGLSTRQVSIWFANQRQRRKPYKIPERDQNRGGHRLRKPSSSPSSNDLASSPAMPSLSSSPSSRASSGSWDSSPVFALTDPFEQKPNFDQFSSYLAQCIGEHSFELQLPYSLKNEITLLDSCPKFDTFQLPTEAFSAPSLALNFEAGIGEDFWQSIMQNAGLGVQQQSPQDDVLANIAIAPTADDWSTIFGNLDFTSFQ